MTKLDDAITHFNERSTKANGTTYADLTLLACALHEIRDRIEKSDNRIDDLYVDALTEQPAPQPEHTFEPWSDVVEIIGPDEEDDLGFVGVEGVLIDVLPGPLYKVHVAEFGGNGCFPASSLRLVYRLKPRVQTPQMVAFQGLDSVINPKGVSPQLGFKEGDWIYDEETDRQEEISEVHDCTVVTKAGRILYKPLVRKINKPAPFQVGDWVRDTRDGLEFRIKKIEGDLVCGDTEYVTRLTKHVEKIDPPAPRFTFGDRVRVEHDSDKMVFLYYDDDTRLGPGRAICVNQRASICNVPAEKLLLDTAAD